MSREQTKSSSFIQKLDEARCHGEWNALPELIRKIKKHAPQRVCLTLTAESEHATALEIQQFINGPPLPSSLSTSNSTNKLLSASKYINQLKDAIDKECTYAEDKFQAQVCLSTIYWLQGETALALSSLPKEIHEEFSQTGNNIKESPRSLRLCFIKASYIKGILLQKESADMEALFVFHSTLPILSKSSISTRQDHEVRLWTELFLIGACTLSSDILKKSYSPELIKNTLIAFRLWSKFWNSSKSVGGRLSLADFCRRDVWKEYYIILSKLLEKGLSFDIEKLSTSSNEEPPRLQQRAELSRVEAYYESLLMAEIDFPKADEASQEVEEFVEVLMRNWRINCGIEKSNQGFGDIGIETISRGVLEILYRAVKKTFHSTSILRHLFTVHLVLGEINLAFKAFDIYLVTVMKGKSRVEKTGHKAAGLDDDDTVLKVASEYIKALCRYGSYEFAEKANKTSMFFEDWLETRYSIDSNEGKNSSIPPQTFALIWRCIGIGYAQWARTTFDAVSRSDVQSKAIECFNKSLLPQFQSSNNPETLFALGCLLAERRQIDAAIRAIKTALLSTSSKEARIEHIDRSRPYDRERFSISLWHLMALLLSARQQFTPALKSCEGAFELLNNPLDTSLGGVSNENKDHPVDEIQKIVNEMDNSERENLLQIKMTQLTLLELLEGPDAAINESYEVLSLYTKLFGEPRTDQTSVDGALLSIPPKSSTGRSFRESILNCSVRKAHDDTSDDQSTPINAPLIHITSDNTRAEKRQSFPATAANSDEKNKEISFSHSKTTENSFNHNSTPPLGSQNQSGENIRRKSDTMNQEQLVLLTKIKTHRHMFSTSIDKSAPSDTTQASTHMTSSDVTSKKLVKSIEPSDSQENHQNPATPKLSSCFNPAIVYSKKEQKRLQITVLIKVWLLIGGFYRRASMYDDAQGAIDEALQLVNLIEFNLLNDPKSSSSCSNFKWEGGKTVAELRSDIYSELGYLAIEEGSPHSAINHFESALLHFRNHPNAIVGLSNILMDIYTKKLLIPSLTTSVNLNTITPSLSSLDHQKQNLAPTTSQNQYIMSMTNSRVSRDILNPVAVTMSDNSKSENSPRADISERISFSAHEINYKDPSPALLNRLAARDRAFGLLSSLTKTGLGWNQSEAWFALARAYEESGQLEKAKEVLWWCVELEDGRGVRDWTVVNCSGYVL